MQALDQEKDLPERLKYASSHNLPLDYVVFNKRTKKYENLDDIVKGPKKSGKKQEPDLEEQLSQFRDNYITNTYYPFFILWYKKNLKSLTNEAKNNLFSYLQPHKNILGSTKIGVEYSDEVDRFSAAFQAKVKETKERYLKFTAKRDVNKITLTPKLNNTVHDISIKELTSVFTTKERKSAEQVFNDIIISEDVPFCLYQDDLGGVESKAYSRAESQVPRWASLGNFDEPIPKGRLTAVIRYTPYNYKSGAEKPTTLLHYLPNTSSKRLADAEYEFSYRKPIDVVDPTQLQKIIEQHLNLLITETKTTTVKANFVILDVVVVPELLLHLLATDIRFLPLIYVKERTGAFAAKERLTLYYDAGNNSRAMITLKQSEYTKIASSFYLNGVEKKYADRLYMQVKIAQASDRKTVDDIKEVFTKLISVYLQEEERIKAIYQSIFSIDLVPVLKEKPTTKITGLHELQKLDRRFSRQGRAYQKDSQVTPITTVAALSESEDARAKLEAAKKEYIEITGPAGKKIREPKQILLDNGVYYTSNVPGKPYIGYKNKPSTRGEELPHCYAKKRLDIDPDTCLIREKIVIGGNKKQRKATAAAPINSLKLLQPDGIGLLTDGLDIILKHHTKDILNENGEEDKSRRFVRRSRVHYSSSSFLHSVLNVINDINYMMSKNPEEYVRQIRKAELPEYAVLCRQECYDMTLDQIKRELGGTDYLDPQKYYRALEEWASKRTGTKYRIYTFATETRDSPVTTLLLPRNKLFHLRNYKDNSQPILIFCYYGQACDVAEYPECDAIAMVVNKRQNKTNKKGTGSIVHTMIKSKQLNDRLQNLLKEISSIRRIEFIPPQDVHDDDKGAVVSVVKDPQDVPEVSSLFPGFDILVQQIDDYGKLRGLKLNDRKTRQLYIIYTPPLVPINAPEEELFGLPMIYEEAVSFFKILKVSPIYYVARDDEEGNEIIESVHGYIGRLLDPIGIKIEDQILEEIPEDFVRNDSMRLPIGDTKGSVLQKLQRLKISQSQIMQFLEDKFIELKLEQEDMDELIDPFYFIDTYTVVREGYDYKEGIFENVKEGKGKSQTIQRKVILDSERVKNILYACVRNILNKNRRLPAHLLFPPGREIGKEVIYVPDLEQLARWVSTIINKNDQLKVHNGIEVDVLRVTEQPYYIRTIENDIYIIQRVIGDTLSSAQTCSYNWQLYSNNTGWKTLANTNITWKPEGTKEITLVKDDETEKLIVYNFNTTDKVGIKTDLIKLPITCEDDPTERWAALLYVGTS